VRKGIKVSCKLRILVLSLILNLFLFVINVFCRETNAIMILENAGIETTLHTISKLEAAGFRAHHVLSPRIILGHVSSDDYAIIAANDNVRLVSKNFGDALPLKGIRVYPVRLRQSQRRYWCCNLRYYL